MFQTPESALNISVRPAATEISLNVITAKNSPAMTTAEDSHANIAAEAERSADI